MAEIHDALPHTRFHRHGLGHTPIGGHRLFGADPPGIGAGDIATVPVEAHQPVFCPQGRNIQRGFAQRGHEIDRDRVVVVMAELQTGLVHVAGVVDHLLADRAVRAGRPGDDAGLGEIRQQCLEARAVFRRQRGAHEEQKDEIGIRLRLQPGQADTFEVAEPFFHARGGIEIGFAAAGVVMFDLKAALGGIGKPAEPDHLHYRASSETSTLSASHRGFALTRRSLC